MLLGSGVGCKAEGSGAGYPRFLKHRPSAPHSGPCDVAGPILTNFSEVRAASIFAYSRKNFTCLLYTSPSPRD
eukprot:12666967-Alexandrium_andersonii.AAC.1